MLSPEYLLRVSEGGEKIAESLHNDIVAKIVDRITLRLDRGDNYILTAQDKWQIQVLQESGMLLEDIQKIIAKSTGLMQKEIASAMEEAGVKAIEYDNAIYEAAGLSPEPLEQSPHLIRLMQRTYEATNGEWINFTRTIATATQQAFIKACDEAYMKVATGAYSYSEAFKDAIKSIVSNGVYVQYPSGHRDTIETATMRCIRTGVSQATAQITDARMEEMDWDTVLVSSHLGARVTGNKDYTDHYWWQGKFYSRSGKDKRFLPYSVCGEGDVQGIHGANCRHSHGPGDGEFNPYEHYDSEENRKEYELQQRQRTLERRIRDSKRECMGLKEAADKAGTPEGKAKLEAEYQKQAALLQKRNAAYNQFCEDNNLKKLNERITIAKWDRKQAAQARVAAKKKKPQISAKKPKDYSVFSTLNVTKADSIRPQSIITNLKKSEIGKKTIEYLEKEGVPVNLCYGIDNPEKYAGTYDPFDDVINVHCDITKTTMETAKTVIHEATHRQMGCTHTFAEEFSCFKAEIIHEKGQLTKEDAESIIKHIQKHYPDLR